MGQLTSELIRDDDIWTLKLIGSVDYETYALMWSLDSSVSLLNELRKAKVQLLVIDLADVQRIDSQGLRLLLKAQKQFSPENIEIMLRNPNPHLSRLFQIMQFDHLFDIEIDD